MYLNYKGIKQLNFLNIVTLSLLIYIYICVCVCVCVCVCERERERGRERERPWKESDNNCLLLKMWFVDESHGQNVLYAVRT